jgi:hypothetical protein
MPRGFPKYEATKRLGHINMRGTPRLGASVPRGTMVDECMGFVWATGSMKGHDDSFGHMGSQRGTTPPKDTRFAMVTFGVPIREQGHTTKEGRFEDKESKKSSVVLRQMKEG